MAAVRTHTYLARLDLSHRDDAFCFSTSSPIRSKSALLLLSGQWQDIPARECSTKSGRASPIEALAAYATQLAKLLSHYQAHLGITKPLPSSPWPRQAVCDACCPVAFVALALGRVFVTDLNSIPSERAGGRDTPLAVAQPPTITSCGPLEVLSPPSDSISSTILPLARDSIPMTTAPLAT